MYLKEYLKYPNGSGIKINLRKVRKKSNEEIAKIIKFAIFFIYPHWKNKHKHAK